MSQATVQLSPACLLKRLDPFQGELIENFGYFDPQPDFLYCPKFWKLEIEKETIRVVIQTNLTITDPSPYISPDLGRLGRLQVQEGSEDLPRLAECLLKTVGSIPSTA